MHEKVLIADQDPELSLLLALHLRNEEYQVICAHDAEATIEVARYERPDIVLIDVSLQLDGVSIYEHQSDFPELASIPALVLVTRTFARERRGMNVPAHILIEKPVVSHELVRKVAAALDNHDGTSAGEPHQRVA